MTDAIAYYRNLQKGLDNRFKNAFRKSVSILRETPFFQIRYKEFRVLQIRKFLYLIHYHIDESQKEIVIPAVICTHRNPDEHWL